MRSESPSSLGLAVNAWSASLRTGNKMARSGALCGRFLTLGGQTMLFPVEVKVTRMVLLPGKLCGRGRRNAAGPGQIQEKLSAADFVVAKLQVPIGQQR